MERERERERQTDRERQRESGNFVQSTWLDDDDDLCKQLDRIWTLLANFIFRADTRYTTPGHIHTHTHTHTHTYIYVYIYIYIYIYVCVCVCVCVLLYKPLVNSNRYVPFFINTLETIVRVGNSLTVTDSGGCLIWEAPHSRDAADSPHDSKGAVPQVLTLLGEARFVALRPMRPFSGECRRGSWTFWNRRACLSYGPAPGPTLKRLCAILARFVGRPTNNGIFWLSNHHYQLVFSSCCLRELYLFYVIKISISFITSVLVISYSVTFYKVTTHPHTHTHIYIYIYLYIYI